MVIKYVWDETMGHRADWYNTAAESKAITYSSCL